MRIRPVLLCATAASALVALVATPDPSSGPGVPSPGSGGDAPRDIIPRAVAGLADRSAAVRDAATETLVRLGPAALAAVEAVADSPDPEVRSRARAVLGRAREDRGAASRRRTAEAAAVLRDAAPGDLEPGGPADVRLSVLRPESGDALADLALRSARRSLLDGRLARALVRHASPRALGALARLWRDDRALPSAVLDAARDLEALLGAGDERSVRLRDAAREAARELGDPLGVREAPRRRAGVALAAALSGPAAADLFRRAARDPDPAVRREVSRALAVHLGGAGRPALRALAGDRDPEVRAAALEALATVPGTLDPGPAVAASADSDAAVRRSAAALLGREATAEELPVLHRLAVDESPRVRLAARRSLVALGLRSD